MKHRTSYFPIGSSYYPPFHTPEDWIKDTDNMVRSGLNMIRTAELLASWDYIESRPGQPEWDWLDRLFELASERNIQILLGTGSCNAPIWMLELYPDLRRISREGMAYPTNTVWGWACTNNPGLRSELERYLKLLLERYAQHPMLFGWQIDNQIGHGSAFTHNSETRRSRQYAYYCYCDHCARGFREWLERKYGHVDRLNKEWAWDPTHYRYYSWHQIQPPRSLPAEWGNGTAWLDFRRFQLESLTDYVAWQHRLIKAHDPKQLTLHNLYSCLRPDMGARNEPDHWAIGGVPDIIGHDMYPSENNYKKDPAYSSWFLDFGYSVAHHNQRTFTVLELESGPIGGFSAGPNFATSGLDIKRFNLACLGHGAKIMLYQGYRDWNCIPLHWGALVDYHGEPTERFHAAAEVNRVVREHQDFFLDALPARAEVALYHSVENVVVLDGQANEKLLYQALRGAHTALWREGFATDFVAPQYIGSRTADYKAILLPFVMHMPKEHAQYLTNYVENGGTLVGFAKLAHLDEKGWAWNDRPGAGLDQLFGAVETHLEVFREYTESLDIEVDPSSPLFAGVQTKTIKGYWHRQTFQLADDVEVLAHFVDGNPAIIRRGQGKGQAILIATHLDMAVLEYSDPATERVFANLMELCGVKPTVLLQGSKETYIRERVDAHLLIRGREQMVILNNEGDQAVEVTVTIPDAGQATSALELFSQQNLSLRQVNGAQFTLTLPAVDGVAVLLR